MNFKRIVILVLLFFSITMVIGQDIGNLPEILEYIAQNTDEEVDFSDLINEIEILHRNPVYINSDDVYRLRDIYLLNDFRINNLRSYRIEYGNILSIYELQAIEGFDKRSIQLIAPFITMKKPEKTPDISGNKLIKYSKNDLFIRFSTLLEKQSGYIRNDSIWLQSPNKFYIGNPQKYYLKYNYNYKNNIRLGFVAEKDPGEIFLGSHLPDSLKNLINDKLKPGFDFYSVYFYLHKFNKIESFVVGDYSLNFGQGLTLWSGFSFSKSPEAVFVKKFPTGIKPSTSVSENLSFRGTAATIKTRHFSISGFFSKNKIDGNVVLFDTLEGKAVEVSSLQNTGYHRTVGELEDKNTVERIFAGGHISFRNKRLQIGATAHKTFLSARLEPSMHLYNQFDFRGKEILNAGLDFNLLLRHFNFFGEAAMSDNGGHAFLLGALINMDSRVQLSVLYRDYQKNYQNLYSNAFGENSENQDEVGIYTGIHSKLSKWLTLSAYCDLFKFPWLKYRVDAPSEGSEFFLQAEITPGDNVMMYIRYKQKQKPVNSSSKEFIPQIIHYTKNTWRFHIDYMISEQIKMRDRVEISEYFESPEDKNHGYLLYHDIIYSDLKDRLKLYFRYALFDTDDYDTRIYTYENDVLYAFSIPSFFNKGTRMYFMAKYALSPDLDIWLKLSRTAYTNQTSIGTGKAEIKGNKKSEVKLQLRVKF